MKTQITLDSKEEDVDICEDQAREQREFAEAASCFKPFAAMDDTFLAALKTHNRTHMEDYCTSSVNTGAAQEFADIFAQVAIMFIPSNPHSRNVPDLTPSTGSQTSVDGHEAHTYTFGEVAPVVVRTPKDVSLLMTGSCQGLTPAQRQMSSALEVKLCKLAAELTKDLPKRVENYTLCEATLNDETTRKLLKILRKRIISPQGHGSEGPGFADANDATGENQESLSHTVSGETFIYSMYDNLPPM